MYLLLIGRDFSIAGEGLLLPFPFHKEMLLPLESDLAARAAPLHDSWSIN
jgi:hypothetical protein